MAPAGDFPNQVNTIQAPAVEGDFASANPRSTVLAGEGALIAGNGVIDGVLVEGIVVGRFGWLSYERVDSDQAPAIIDTFGAGQPAGLVHREQIGYITPYLATASMVLLKGQAATLFNSVDLWVKNRGSTFAQVGMKAFANFADGSAYFAVAGTTPPGGSGDASSVAAATFTATGSIAGNVLNVTNVAAGNLYAGATFSGSGVASGTKIVEQLSGAAGGVGIYAVSIPEQAVASTALAGTYGVLTVGGTVVAGFAGGQTISGSGVVAGTKVYQQLTGGIGAAGTYVVDNNTVVSSTAITSQASIETKWYCKSAGAANEIVKVSDTF